MKRFALVLAALLLGLSACAPAAEPEATPEPIPVFSSPTGIYADWSKLNTPEYKESVGTRLSEGKITELIASNDYGRIMPYVGERVDDLVSQWNWQYRYGLVTMEGCVILDPVLSSVRTIEGDDEYAFIIGKAVEDEGNVTNKYALCASDASWCTDFLYDYIFINSSGDICLLEEAYDDDGAYMGISKATCIMDFAGNVIVNLSDLKPEVELLDDGDFYDEMNWLYEYSDGYRSVKTKDNMAAYLDKTGKILKSDEIDGIFAQAFTFRDGVAVVQLEREGLWGIIDNNGKWVKKPQFKYIDPSTDVVTVAETADGRRIVIDLKGNELLDISSIDLVLDTIYVASLEKGIIVIQRSGDEEFEVFDENLNVVGTVMSATGFVDVAIIKQGDHLAIYDGAESTPLKGEYNYCYNTMDGYILAVTEDNEGQLINREGNAIITMPDCEFGVHIATDCINGEKYLIRWGQTTMSVKDTQGKSVITYSVDVPNIFNGYINLIDETGSEIINFDGKVIFRTPIDFTD